MRLYFSAGTLSEADIRTTLDKWRHESRNSLTLAFLIKLDKCDKCTEQVKKVYKLSVLLFETHARRGHKGKIYMCSLDLP